MAKFLYTTMDAVTALAHIANPSQYPIFSDTSPLPRFVDSMLLVRLPKHETYAGTDEGLNLLFAWSNLYAVKSLTTLAPHLFTETSTFEGDTVIKRQINFRAFVEELNTNLKNIEDALLALGVGSEPASYGLIGKATPTYNPIEG